MSQNSSHREQRRFPRVNVDVSVRYSVAGGKKAKPREERLMTVGEGGAFIRTKLTYPAGTKLEVSFALEKDQFRAVAQVRYAVVFKPSGGPIQFPGMGIQFEEIEKDSVAKIRGFVARQLEKENR
jgi:Tfp pilus assembly protein PilZ